MANDLVVKDAQGNAIALNYGDAAGIGLEHAHETGTTPFLELLQPLSKVCTQRLIPGAMPGMFCIKSARKLYPETGVNYIAVAEIRNFVEWKPRDAGGGYVAEYGPTDPVVLNAMKANAGKKVNLRTSTGNNLNETFRQIGFIADDWADLTSPERLQPVVVSFERMKIPARASIMDRMRLHRGSIPLFAAKLRMTSHVQPSKKGDFHNYVLSFAVEDDLLKSLIPPTDPLWPEWCASCTKLAAQFRSGEIKMEKPSEDGDAVADDGGVANAF